jgi:O-antigen/teichoic acid export membrane protein/aminoglycoside phosphotransferase
MMTTGTTTGTTTGIAASLASHLREPMRRSAYALIAGTGLTSILGMVFWVLAARLLTSEAVGTGTALTSAMIFLGTLSTLGLGNALVRFLAPAGDKAKRVIAACYGLCVATAMLAALIFIAGQPWWASQLGFLRQNALLAATFVLATAVWVIFVLEDRVLIGLRRAGWVPLTNGMHSIIKIGLLPLLAAGGAYALFTAFALPALPIVLLVTILILRMPSRSRTVSEPVENLRISHLFRFAAADYTSALLWLATTDLMTLVVLEQMGAQQSAYYFMSFTIAYSLYLITSNVGSALVAEAAQFPTRATVLIRNALRHAATLVVPSALIGIVLAPLGLRILGREYSSNGTILLRLLLLSAIAQVIIGIAVSAARIRRDNRMVLTVYAIQALGIFGGTALTIDRWGLTGVGLSWLVSQTTIAVVLLATRRVGWNANTHYSGGLLSYAGRLVSQVRRSRSRHHAWHLVPAALKVCGLQPVPGDCRLLPSYGDSLIVSVPGDTEPTVLKIATTAAASRGLNRHAEMLSDVRARLGPAQLAALLPTVIQHVELGGHTFLLETKLPGTTDQSPASGSAELAAAALPISDLHQTTGSVVSVDEALLAEWVDAPLAQLRRLSALDGSQSALDRLRDMLYDALLGQLVTTSFVHGDYWLGNVLLDRDSDSVKVTGIADWENARAVGLPDCDLIHLWLTSQPEELGSTVRQAVLSPETVQEGVGQWAVSWSNPQLSTPHLVLLTWLWHVTAELERASKNRVGRLWLARSVKPVLKFVKSGDAPRVLKEAR